MGEKMHKFKKYLKNKKYILLFVATLFVFGIVTGLFLSVSNINHLKDSVMFYAENIREANYNYILIHFFLLVISFVTSFLGIGIPLLCSILFYEGLTCGFLIGIFTVTYQIGGFIYAFLFILILKGIYLILFLIFFFKCLNIARKMIGKYIYKTDVSTLIIRLIKACGCIIFITFLNDLFILLVGDKILPLFHFLLS